VRNALFALVLVVVLCTGCVQTQGPVTLSPVEVNNYSGQKLSSVNDFVDTSINGTQYINVSTYRLSITGLVDNPEEYTYAQVIDDHQSYQKVVTLNCVEGWSATILWQGVLVRDLLNEAGPKPGATTVIFEGSDGYTSEFPISYFYDNDILMAYKLNNITLPAAEGFPFILVAENKWGYKWVEWITEINVSNDTSYEGYWESRGYSDSGDLNQSFIK
jgi:DMSO/TMAO reductase YedYZ molybdopterin-dependent catalytic subunit